MCIARHKELYIAQNRMTKFNTAKKVNLSHQKFLLLQYRFQIVRLFSSNKDKVCALYDRSIKIGTQYLHMV